jgi:hypothetical protein
MRDLIKIKKKYYKAKKEGSKKKKRKKKEKITFVSSSIYFSTSFKSFNSKKQAHLAAFRILSFGY